MSLSSPDSGFFEFGTLPSFIQKLVPHKNNKVHIKPGKQIDEIYVFAPGAKTLLVNHSSALMLEFCDGKRSLSQIVQEIEKLFPDMKHRIATDVFSALDTLNREGLVRMETGVSKSGSLASPEYIANDIVKHVTAAGSASLQVFGGTWEGGYRIQQEPEEFARLIGLLSAYAPFKNSLDIGIASGGAARLLRELVDIENTVTIDDGGYLFNEWKANKQCLRNPPIEIIGDSHSEDVAQRLQDLNIKFDLVQIDGDHSYEGVTQDWGLVVPYLNPGAIVWFHDINPIYWEGVRQFWEETFVRTDSPYNILLETKNLGIGVIRCPEPPQV